MWRLFRVENKAFDEKIGILNILKLNVSHEINLIFRIINNTIPEAFENKFEIVHKILP